jgi:glycolate oxidase iron-sulfur subunit
VCPAGVNAGKVSLLSKQILTETGKSGYENSYARMIARTTTKFMNPLGMRKRSDRWSEGIKFDRKAEFLLYTGNMFQVTPYTRSINRLRKTMGKRASGAFARIIAAFPGLIKLTSRFRDRELEDTMNGTLRNIVRLLQESGLTLQYLGKEEPYPGTFLYDLGYLDEFREYARKVCEILRSTGIRKVVTVDPHTYDLLKNAFPQYVEDFDLEVYHYLDLLGDLKLQNMGEKITFHEPCHFILREPKFQKAKELLQKTAEVRLPARSGNRTRCCGGPDELTFPEIAEKASSRRYEELKSTGADLVVTACPVCYVNLSKGKDTMEIADFLVSRLKPKEAA